MNAVAPLLKVIGHANQRLESVFGTPPPAEVLVKEVVMFQPAPDPYLALQRASQRASEGRSVFVDTVLGDAQER